MIFQYFLHFLTLFWWSSGHQPFTRGRHRALQSCFQDGLGLAVLHLHMMKFMKHRRLEDSGSMKGIVSPEIGRVGIHFGLLGVFLSDSGRWCFPTTKSCGLKGHMQATSTAEAPPHQICCESRSLGSLLFCSSVCKPKFIENSPPNLMVPHFQILCLCKC